MSVDVVYIAIVVAVILISMTIHEAMHGFVAHFLGDDTAEREGRLTFNPIKHIDPVMTLLVPVVLAVAGGPIFGAAKPVPFNPNRLRYDEWGMALVAAAGPFSNLLIAFISFGFWVFLGAPQTGIVNVVLSITLSVNIGFFVFNMLPIPPLDGSRLLYVFAPDFVRRGMEAIEQAGLFFILILVIVASGPLSQVMQAASKAILQGFGYFFGIS